MSPLEATAQRHTVDVKECPHRSNPAGDRLPTAVTVARAWLSEVSSASRVRAFTVRKTVFTFDQPGSIGDRSGELGGQDRRAPRAPVASRGVRHQHGGFSREDQGNKVSWRSYDDMLALHTIANL